MFDFFHYITFLCVEQSEVVYFVCDYEYIFFFTFPSFQLCQRGTLDPEATQLFLNISEKARQAVEVYFNLDTELFFAYTHLVCRTALPG